MDDDTGEHAATLEAIALRLIEATNARDFDNPIWTDSIADHLEFTSNGSSNFDRFMGEETWGHEYADKLKLLTTTFPHLQVHVQDLSARVVGLHQVVGEVFIHTLTTGNFPGLSTPVVNRLEFRFIRHRWRLVKHSWSHGIDPF
ncbi:Hypothetical predicted protein [Lecanosticta acicola]|uniref:SnoaL-like domain-containing protein n=1 Tax=Lecanosticta acicola TaxID=111012 RepID=A0AAI9E9G6_9PEZI|nr:Hypothetical predicted protein [Lecanosticta acicola]